MDVIKKSAHLYPLPNQKQGYGKPDFMFASQIIDGSQKPEDPGMYLQVYPNPARHNLYLGLPASIAGNFTYRIVDMSGRNIQSGEISLRAGSASISLDHFNAGTYMIILEGNTEIYKSLFTRE